MLSRISVPVLAIAATIANLNVVRLILGVEHPSYDLRHSFFDDMVRNLMDIQKSCRLASCTRDAHWFFRRSWFFICLRSFFFARSTCLAMTQSIISG